MPSITHPDNYPFFYRRAQKPIPRVLYRDISLMKGSVIMEPNLNAAPYVGANMPPNVAPNVAPMPTYTAPAYDYGCPVYSYACPPERNDFVLIVILFILLIIVGAVCYSFC